MDGGEDTAMWRCSRKPRGEKHTGKNGNRRVGTFSLFVFSLYFEMGSLIVEDNLELLIFMPKLTSQTQIEWTLTIGR